MCFQRYLLIHCRTFGSAIQVAALGVITPYFLSSNSYFLSGSTIPSQASLTLFLAFVQAVPMATMLSLAAFAGLQKYSIRLLASLHVPTRVFFESSAAKDSEVSNRGRASKKPSRIIFFSPPELKNTQPAKSWVRSVGNSSEACVNGLPRSMPKCAHSSSRP